MAGLRSSFAASGGALDLLDGAAGDDNGGGGAAERVEPRCGALQQVRLLFGRSWCALTLRAVPNRVRVMIRARGDLSTHSVHHSSEKQVLY